MDVNVKLLARAVLAPDPGANWVRDCVGTRASLRTYKEEKSLRSCLESSTDSTVVQSVAWCLYQPKYLRNLEVVLTF
jgi:hypothetical protein